MKKAANEEISKRDSRNTHPVKAEELKTDFPLSEKDEVKQAESNMRKRRRHML